MSSTLLNALSLEDRKRMRAFPDDQTLPCNSRH
jgi:hypothetical protein